MTNSTPETNVQSTDMAPEGVIAIEMNSRSPLWRGVALKPVGPVSINSIAEGRLMIEGYSMMDLQTLLAHQEKEDMPQGMIWVLECKENKETIKGSALDKCEDEHPAPYEGEPLTAADVANMAVGGSFCRNLLVDLGLTVSDVKIGSYELCMEYAGVRSEPITILIME